MARKATEIVQVNLRIREELRRRLDSAAKANGVSLNAEMANRLYLSFDRDTLRSLQEIATDIGTGWAKFAERFEKLELADEMVRAIEGGDFEQARRAAFAYVKTGSGQEDTQ